MVRINTDGDYAWREDLYERVGDRLGERAVVTDGGMQLDEQRVCDVCANMSGLPCFDCYLAGYRDTAGAIESDDAVDVELDEPAEGA